MMPPRASWSGLAAVVAASALALAPPPRCAGQDATHDVDGLTVVGKGLVKAKPTLAEIEMNVVAAAELTGDAIVKFRDARRRVVDAFAALKLPDVTLEEFGPMVDQKGAAFNPYVMDMGTPARAKSEVQLSRKLVARAGGIRAMDEEAVFQLVGRLLDVAQDAGAKVGPPVNSAYMAYRYGTAAPTNLVRFVVEGHEELKDEAFARAAADARGRAERMARASDVELGPVLSIFEVPAPAPRNPLSSIYGLADPAENDSDGVDRLTTPKFEEVSIRVHLRVRYAIRARGAKP